MIFYILGLKAPKKKKKAFFKKNKKIKIKNFFYYLFYAFAFEKTNK